MSLANEYALRNRRVLVAAPVHQRLTFRFGRIPSKLSGVGGAACHISGTYFAEWGGKVSAAMAGLLCS